MFYNNLTKMDLPITCQNIDNHQVLNLGDFQVVGLQLILHFCLQSGNENNGV